MHHCLLITGLVIAKLRILLQRLPYPGYTTMTKNTETPRKKRVFLTITFYILLGEVLNLRLRHC